jgi:hypothetical protein
MSQSLNEKGVPQERQLAVPTMSSQPAKEYIHEDSGIGRPMH